jgi:hypothetical protein
VLGACFGSVTGPSFSVVSSNIAAQAQVLNTFLGPSIMMITNGPKMPYMRDSPI